MLQPSQIEKIVGEVLAQISVSGENGGASPAVGETDGGSPFRVSWTVGENGAVKGRTVRSDVGAHNTGKGEPGAGDSGNGSARAGDAGAGAVGTQKSAEGKSPEKAAAETPERPEKRRAPAVEWEDPESLVRMQGRTKARIGVGKAGPRLRTETLLGLRADHAMARDAVLMDVDPALLERMNLYCVTTRCQDKNTYLTRPDLGRSFEPETEEVIRQNCAAGPDVQLIVSDGLSSSAIQANAERILPVVEEGLRERGIKVGTPIFVKYGRVAAQDRLSELLGAKVVCSFIGERPGLATAESMSAYISYGASVGMPEARRTVVSNIHRDGVPAVEAGAYIVDLIALILEQKASGVELKK